MVLATCIAAAGCVEAAGDFRNAPAAHHFATAPYPRQKKTVEGLVMSQSIDLCTSIEKNWETLEKPWLRTGLSS